jgi:peroxiredoxin
MMKDRSRLRAASRRAIGGASLIALVALCGCTLQVRPIAILASSVITGPAPLTIGFDLSYSVHPQDSPLTYTLDFGDGSEADTGTEFGIVLHHTYEESGVYEANLTVTDAEGNRGSDTLTITVGDDGPPVGIEIGMTAPDFAAHTTDGGEFALSDARGRVVLLDFWGVWCPWCKKTLPHLDQLVKAYGTDGVIAVLISTDALEQDSIDYLTENGYVNFVSVWEPGGKSTRIAGLYGVLGGGPVGIPHTFVLDRHGVIRWAGHPRDLSPEIVESLL